MSSWKVEVRDSEFQGETRQVLRGLGEIRKDELMSCLARENVCAVAYERGEINSQRTTDFDEWDEEPASKDLEMKDAEGENQ